MLLACLVLSVKGVQLDNEPMASNQFVQSGALSDIAQGSYSAALSAIDAADVSENQKKLFRAMQ